MDLRGDPPPSLLGGNVGITLAIKTLDGLSSGIWATAVLSTYLYALMGSNDRATQDVGIAQAIQGLCMAATALPAAWLCARRLRKDSVLLFLALVQLAAIGVTSWSLISDDLTPDLRYQSLCVALALWGMAQGSQPVVDSLLADSIPTGRRTQVLTLLQARSLQLAASIPYSVKVCYILAVGLGPAVSAGIFYWAGDTWSLDVMQLVILCGQTVALFPALLMVLLSDDRALGAESEAVQRIHAYAMEAAAARGGGARGGDGGDGVGALTRPLLDPEEDELQGREGGEIGALGGEGNEDQNLEGFDLSPLKTKTPRGGGGRNATEEPSSPPPPPAEPEVLPTNVGSHALRDFDDGSEHASSMATSMSTPTATRPSSKRESGAVPPTESGGEGAGEGGGGRGSASPLGPPPSASPPTLSAARRHVVEALSSKGQWQQMLMDREQRAASGQVAGDATTAGAPAISPREDSPPPTPKLFMSPRQPARKAPPSGMRGGGGGVNGAAGGRSPIAHIPSPGSPPPSRGPSAKDGEGANEEEEGGGGAGGSGSATLAMAAIEGAAGGEGGIVASSSLMVARRRTTSAGSGWIPVILALTDVVMGLASGMTIKFFPIFFQTEVGLPPTSVAMVYSAIPFSLAIFSILAQRQARLIGRVQSIVINRALGIALLFFIALHPEVWPRPSVIIPACIVRASLMNCNYAIQKSILMDYVPKAHRPRWLSVDSLVQFGWSGSAAIGGWLIHRTGFQTTFVVTAYVQLFGCVCSMLLLPLVPVRELTVEEILAGEAAVCMMTTLDGGGISYTGRRPAAGGRPAAAGS